VSNRRYEGFDSFYICSLRERLKRLLPCLMKYGIEKEEDETPGYETPTASPSKKQKKVRERSVHIFNKYSAQTAPAETDGRKVCIFVIHAIGIPYR